MTLAATAPPRGRRPARRELLRLRLEVERLELTRGQRHEVDAAIEAAEGELARAAPDPRRVAGHLARVTTVLRSADALGDPRGGVPRALARLRLSLGPLPF